VGKKKYFFFLCVGVMQPTPPPFFFLFNTKVRSFFPLFFNHFCSLFYFKKIFVKPITDLNFALGTWIDRV